MLTVGLLCSVAKTPARQTTFKVAFYNIQSGKGEPALPGRASTFVDTSNCTDPAKPLNAWGVGLVQRELRDKVAADPAILALGLGEAWSCATPSRVAALLGWTASSSRNGVSIVSRFGFAGPEIWQQLDTSLNPTPADTMWVLRVPICVDAACSRSVPVHVGHWYAVAEDPAGAASMDRQAEQTLAFLQQPGQRSRVLIGDLNVWESETAIVCRQTPFTAGLARLRSAGYIDAWRWLHGQQEGFTGMTNRVRCGVPEGYAWKRIDYAWSSPDLVPISMSRFGVVPAGEEAPSDHYGIVAEYPLPDDSPEVVPQSSTAVAGPGDAVVHLADAGVFGGKWRVVADASAATGRAVEDPDNGIPKLTSAAAAPVNYVDLSFTAEARRPYHLWVRGRAAKDHWTNDSLFVQFAGSVTAEGAPIWRIGTTSATVVSIERCTGCGLRAWGWADNGYGVEGALVYFAKTGQQRLRIQSREDGVRIDQILLSPMQYLHTPPGAPKNDATIYPTASAVQ